MKFKMFLYPTFLYICLSKMKWQSRKNFIHSNDGTLIKNTVD